MGSVDPREPLRAVLGVHRVSDAEIRRLLRTAAADLTDVILANPLDTGVGTALRQAQLRIQADEILRTLWLNTGRTVTRGRLAAVARAAQLGESQMRQLLGDLPPRAVQQLLDGTRMAARMAVARATARLAGEGAYDLSVRVYRNYALMRGRVDRMVNSAIARNLGARELAREARAYILPTAPGGASYSALRLARTEINNSFHAMTTGYYADNPLVDQMRWQLSRSHPRADTCDDLVGDYSKLEVPSKPHPQCFCYVTPAPLNEREVLRRLDRGELDSWLQRMGV